MCLFFFINKKTLKKNFYKRGFFLLIKGKSSIYRIGPHNVDFISFLLGSILGDTHLEKREKGLGTRIVFEQCQRNIEYLMWFQKFLVIRGYAPNIKLNLKIRIKKNNKVFYFYRINSYTFFSLNWLYELFYQNKVKKIPQESYIWNYFTEFSLAIWYMDGGSKTKSGFKFATNCFDKKDIEYLCFILHKKFNLNTSIHLGGKNKGFIIYIKSDSKNLFISLIEPYMIQSMKYKLYNNF